MLTNYYNLSVSYPFRSTKCRKSASMHQYQMLGSVSSQALIVALGFDTYGGYWDIPNVFVFTEQYLKTKQDIDQIHETTPWAKWFEEMKKIMNLT